MRTINITDASELFYEKSTGARMIIKDQKHSVAVSVRVIVGTLASEEFLPQLTWTAYITPSSCPFSWRQSPYKSSED